MIISPERIISWAGNSVSPTSPWSPIRVGPMRAASISAAIPMCGNGSSGLKRIWAFPMRHDAFGLTLAIALATTTALAADNLDLARRLVRYNGGVSLLLRNSEVGLAASSAAPDIFRQSFDKAVTDNQPVIAAADEQIARVYAGLYSTAQLSAEVGFYES